MNRIPVRRLTTLLTGAAVLAGALSITASRATLARQQAENGVEPQAMAQIEALIREKETRTPAERKIDSQLLYAARMAQGLPVAPGVQSLDVDVPTAKDGHAIVDVKGRLTDSLMAQVNGLSSEVERVGDGELQMHVDLDQLLALAAQPDVIFIQPRQQAMTSGARRTPPASRAAAGTDTTQDVPPLPNIFSIGTGQGTVMAQADAAHRTAVFRGLTGINGSGVKIGVLSDGVTHLSQAQALGDLGAVTVLPGQAGTGDEGTAMLELIHDLAPGAQLYFATAFSGITSFADNIRALRTAGCDIIVDDVFYFVETPFQDGQGPAVVSPTNGGAVIQAVKDVTAGGALYFSSAGNEGNLNDGTSGVWEGNFNPGTVVGAPDAGTLHRFTGTQDFNTITFYSGNATSLFWSDPLGGSGNDYDLFRLDSTGASVQSASTNVQDGNDDPYEQVSSAAAGRLLIVQKTGAAARFLHLNSIRNTLSVATFGQIKGHAAVNAEGAFGVAATDASIPFPNAFSAANTVETFSSDGPRRIFYNAAGIAITPGNVMAGGGLLLQKPDLTAADGSFVTGVGGFPSPFYGTSAAAPDAAAIMALFKAQNPGFTNTQLRALLLSTALDIEAPGLDRDSGAGIIMASPPQAGCLFDSPDGTTFPIPASSITNYSITINASNPACAWFAWSDVSWMKVVPPARTGSGPMVLDISANHGPLRSGTITLPGGPLITINQQGSLFVPTQFDQNTPLPIADNTTQESPLTVSGLTLAVANISVSLFLSHTFDDDVVLTLVAPDGTTIPLSTNNGGSADNYGTACSPLSSRTTFEDSGPATARQLSAPFVGSVRPEAPLSKFNGRSAAWANGVWKLRVQDLPGGGTGTLNCWSLHITQAPPFGQVGDFNNDGLIDFSVFRPSTGQWFVYTVGNFTFGLPGDVPVPGDYDGNGSTDAAVFRPATGQWFLNTLTPLVIPFGRAGDIPVPADYDGDERTDEAVFRTTDGPFGVWLLNIPGQPAVAFGLRGDIPMPGDYDGDNRDDLGVYRPSSGQWFYTTAASGFTSLTSVNWGAPADIPVKIDVDGDGRLDFVVFRPSSGTWLGTLSGGGALTNSFGLPGDMPMAYDIDRDGRWELGLWRPATGMWYFRNIVGGDLSWQWGAPGDIPVGARPALPSTPRSDFDGDGVSDLTVFRPSNGTWFMKFSSTGFAASGQTQFGLNGDIRVNGDYDGDHRSDLAVWRPSTGTWFILQSSNGALRQVQWGLNGDKPMPADYDGDGRTDLAVFRPSTATWFIVNSSNNTTTTTQWGLLNDVPLAADFDGDGRAELAVFRPAAGTWFLRMSTSTYGPVITRAWGLNGDLPIVGDFDGDGRSELTVFRPATGEWFSLDALTGALVLNGQFGLAGDTADTHDYDGDGRTDLAVFRVSSATWFVRRSSNGTLLQVQWGLPTDQPVIIR